LREKLEAFFNRSSPGFDRWGNRSLQVLESVRFLAVSGLIGRHRLRTIRPSEQRQTGNDKVSGSLPQPSLKETS
jgi:hypothetical protein